MNGRGGWWTWTAFVLAALVALALSACGPSVSGTCARSCTQAVDCGFIGEDDWEGCRRRCVEETEAGREGKEPACFEAELGWSDCLSRLECDELLPALVNPDRYCPREWETLREHC